MTLLIDAAPLITLLDPTDPLQSTIERIISNYPATLVVPAPVTAEVGYLIGKFAGRSARQAFLADLAAGRFEVGCLEAAEYRLVRELDQQYADLDVGLADLSVVILAHRFRTHRILTADQRHFRAIRPLDGGSFVLLPFDADESAH